MRNRFGGEVRGVELRLAAQRPVWDDVRLSSLDEGAKCTPSFTPDRSVCGRAQSRD
jgi:hypothetical protein